MSRLESSKASLTRWASPSERVFAERQCWSPRKQGVSRPTSGTFINKGLQGRCSEIHCLRGFAGILSAPPKI